MGSLGTGEIEDVVEERLRIFLTFVQGSNASVRLAGSFGQKAAFCPTAGQRRTLCMQGFAFFNRLYIVLHPVYDYGEIQRNPAFKRKATEDSLSEYTHAV